MIRQHIKPVLFVINNDGYTVERLIHGMYEPYNEEIRMSDIKLPAVFGGKNVEIHDVESSKDLQDTFNAINGHPDVMHFVEVKMSVEAHRRNSSISLKLFHNKINNFIVNRV